MTPVSSEETRGLLRTILERQAYRWVKAVDVLGHSLKHVPELSGKAAVANELTHASELFLEVGALYTQHGWRDLDAVVRQRLGRTEYPGSRFEFELSRWLFRRLVDVGMEAYLQSGCKELAAIAFSYRELVARDPLRSEATLVEFCADPQHRPQVSGWVSKWLGANLRSIGRPDTSGDRRAVELGLRDRSTADLQTDYLAAVTPFLGRCGVPLPSAGVMAVELGARASGAA